MTRCTTGHESCGWAKRSHWRHAAALAERFPLAQVDPNVLYVCDERVYSEIASARRRDPSAEWAPHWDYGAYVDVRDVAGAVERALRRPRSGHSRVLLSAQDAWTSAPSRDVARRLLPGVPRRGDLAHGCESRRALVDARGARHGGISQRIS